MARIDDLDGRTLARILNVACYAITTSSARLSTYKQLLQIAAVSRAWREAALAHMHSVLIVEYQAVGSGNDPSSPTRRPSSKKRPAWKSNGTSVRRGRTVVAPVHAPGAWRWVSNASLLWAGGRPVRLRIQSFDAAPEFVAFGLALAGLARVDVGAVNTIEVMDSSEIHTAPEPPRGKATAAVAAAGAARPAEEEDQAAAAAAAAALIAETIPRVQGLTSTSWKVSAASRALMTCLAGHYFGGLHALVAPLTRPIAGARLAENLATLHIPAGLLAQSGDSIVPADRLQMLKLYDCEAFFSWEPFASSSAESSNPDELVFSSLTTLSIDFASENVVSRSAFYESLGRNKYNVRVSMGRDRRRVLFPRLQALSVRKVPYTYTEAWHMFVGAPLRQLAVAGKHAHVRYLDPALLHTAELVDVHTYADGATTGLVKALMAAEAPVRSAWLHHTDTFPLSVPETARWVQLVDLSIAAYIPALALLSLVAQLPVLRRLIAHRIASDADEEPLSTAPATRPWGYLAPPGVPASTSVNELQLHMASGAERTPTLQAICFVLLCMPRLRRLAVRPAYADHVRAFVRHSAELFPDYCADLARIELVPQIFIQSRSPFLMLQ